MGDVARMTRYIISIDDNGETLNTKFGRANIWGNTYIITSKKEGNNRKQLDRLIYEDYYQVTLLKNTHINHKDGNRLNNSISNLEALTKTEYGMINSSKRRTTTGIYRVSKYFAKEKKRWKYTCKKRNGKQTSISSMSILELKKKVENKNLIWSIVDKEKANAVAVECGLNLSDLS